MTTIIRASLIVILFLTALTVPSFSSCFADSGRKELRNKELNGETIVQVDGAIPPNRIDPSRVIQLSWRPRVFLYEGFLTDDECDYLVSLAQGSKEASAKYDDSGKVVNHRLLASSEPFSHVDDEKLVRIEERISAWTFLPKENSKPLQVMHYGIEDAKSKFDYFSNKSSSNLREPLMATIIFSLSNVTRGGEIFFPKSEPKGEIWSDCTKSGNILKPTKGNAILFFNVYPNASPDISSSHARCPVLEGEMWCASKLFFPRAIDGGKILVDSDGNECTDEDENCPRWAAFGECQRNPVFMTGSPDYSGTCRKSCNAC